MSKSKTSHQIQSIHIWKTIDYDAFSFHPANRKINPNNVLQIMSSMGSKFLLQSFPIVVNEAMEIMDGQTRFVAAKRLNKPIFYIIDPDIQIQDVSLLNHSMKWKITDHLHMLSSLKNPHAIEVERRLSESDSAYGIMGILALSGIRAANSENLVDKIQLINSSGEFAIKLRMANDIFRGLGVPISGRFTRPISHIISHTMYDHVRMMRNISNHYHSGFVVPSSDRIGKLTLEHIYNHGIKTTENYVRLSLRG